MADKMAATYVYAVVVTLSQSVLIGFLSNFINGMLLSNSRSGLNTCFVQRMIIKMADKMAAAFLCPLSWSLYLSHFNGISSKFHIWVSSIKLSFKVEFRICPTNDILDG